MRTCFVWIAHACTKLAQFFLASAPTVTCESQCCNYRRATLRLARTVDDLAALLKDPVVRTPAHDDQV